MMTRLEVAQTIPDARVTRFHSQIASTGLSSRITSVRIHDCYTITTALSTEQKQQVRSLFVHPFVRQAVTDESLVPSSFVFAIEVGFLPGVTDNVGSTAQELIQDCLDISFAGQEGVFSSHIYYLNGPLTRKDVEQIATQLHNPLIQYATIRARDELQHDSFPHDDMHTRTMQPDQSDQPVVTEVNLAVSDDELEVLGSQGIPDPQGGRRGPLALHLEYLHAIRDHFAQLGRKPTDVELESLAQTWSEHCKHTIFADPIDEITDGIYRHYIKRATQDCIANRSRNDPDDAFCVSVFSDNAGVIAFSDQYLICDKVETHNTPSALDPYGGAITGVLGVNRDVLGCGMGARPVLNRYFFCFASPGDTTKLYRDQEQNQPMLSAKQILHGVVEGVGDGGNQSGVNTPQGGLFIDHRYRGKPLVFAGTVGLLRRSIAATGQPAHQKQARPGDLIVLIGGKVGLDGIHGATFSSEGLHGNSPVSAVQIGDPITQKKFSDLLIHQARDQGLYTSITDNGAGGLSCSVAEMARESNGCRVELDTVPLKYPGLAPWQIWISESQERMTLAVPPEHWPAFQRLCQSHGVMAASIGQFTDSGSCVVTYQDTTVMDLSLSFLHDGLPSRPMQTKRPQRTLREPYLYLPEEMTDELVSMMGRESIVSTAWISQQYDHEVQGGSVLKPLQGRGRVNAEATVVRPVLTEDQAVAVSQSLYPTYGDIDPYHMVAAAIDTAVRNLVATGVPLDRIALLDNFCWSQSDQPERLYELKQAAEACYDYATAYETPFISGKDSMFNEFQGYDDRGNPIEIAVPPTVLISSVGVMPDFRRAVSIDLKQPGDLIYLLGETDDELGGSEYYAMYAEIGLHVPKVDAARNRSRYQRLSAAIANGLVSSAISVTRGGLAVALAKTALAGRYGVQIDLDAVRGQWLRYDHALFAESQGRVVVSVRPDQQASFEACFEPGDCACIGQVTEADDFRVDHDNEPVVLTNLSMLGSRYYNGLDMI